MSWAQEELRTIALGDRRLDARSALLLEQLGKAPVDSIPTACGSLAATLAAYRLLDHEHITWESILAPHFQRSLERAGEHRIVLALQDTTELDFKGKTIEGLGPLSYEAQRGMYLHPTYLVSPEREPLGVFDAYMWARELKGADGKRPGILESERWIEGYERLAEQAAALPDTRLVYVADREGDMIALPKRALELGTPVDWLVRSSHNRKLAVPDAPKLWEDVLGETSLGEIRFHLGARQGVKARDVTQALYAKRVALPCGKRGETIEVTCVIARELDPPPGMKRVEWRLLTNRLAGTLEEMAELIDWYRARWEIEMFFNVLKTGCRVEALQLASMRKIETALALSMIIAWRINRLMRLGRTCLDLPADLVFETEEWQAAYVLNKKPIPKKVPTINKVVRRIARLGGFLARKGDGEPGVKTIWIGMRRIGDCVEGMRVADQIRPSG